MKSSIVAGLGTVAVLGSWALSILSCYPRIAFVSDRSAAWPRPKHQWKNSWE
jgi:hypothetical protein